VCGGAGTGKGCQYGLSTGYVFTKLYGSAFYETMSKSRLQRLLLLPRIWRTKWSWIKKTIYQVFFLSWAWVFRNTRYQTFIGLPVQKSLAISLPSVYNCFH